MRLGPAAYFEPGNARRWLCGQKRDAMQKQSANWLKLSQMSPDRACGLRLGVTLGLAI
jgi:hypothetical protein